MSSNWMTRRRALRCGAVTGTLGLGGCLRLAGSSDAPADGRDESTTDGGGPSTTATPERSLPESLTPVLRHTLDSDFTDSVNDIDGEPASSGTQFVGDRGGTVLELAGDGAGDDEGYYDIPYSALTTHLSTSDPLTIALWIKPRKLDDWDVFIAGVGAALDIRRGDLRLRWYDPEINEQRYSVSVGATEHLSAETWSHLIGTVDPGNEARLYVDGTEVGATSVSEAAGFNQKGLDSVDAARVGFVPSSDDGAFDSHFGGRVARVELHNGTVGAEGAALLYTQAQE